MGIKNYQIHVNLSDSDIEKLHRIATTKYVTISDFVRTKIRTEQVDS
ncbi:MAG: hypothetical protein NTW30_03400 [Candidatus Aenigmarchaeota archaeon]|nr:hypothetical protein [Candidatus Aenigmarchaeota archaeon]